MTSYCIASENGDETDESILPGIQWNLSFGTPLFKGYLYSGDTKFGLGKMFT